MPSLITRGKAECSVTARKPKAHASEYVDFVINAPARVCACAGAAAGCAPGETSRCALAVAVGRPEIAPMCQLHDKTARNKCGGRRQFLSCDLSKERLGKSRFMIHK